jgi:hypothetical protein
MAALPLVVNYRNKKATLAMTGGAEDVVTVATNLATPPANPTPTQLRFGGNMPGNRATIQMVSTVAWLYHSVVGQVGTDGFPVAANQPQTLTFQDGDVFYIQGASAANLHVLVVNP